MTPREVVRAVIEFHNPPRIPRDMWVLPWAEMNHPNALEELRQRFPGDIRQPVNCWRKHPPTEGDPYAVGRYVDEWGCVFSNAQPGIIGEVKNPIITDEQWADADVVQFPMEWLTVDTEEVNRQCLESDCWVNATACPRPFEQLQYLRGTENLYMDLMDPPPAMVDFMDKMHRFYCELLTVWAKTDVDGLSIMDDWGSQRSLLINPDLWRELFLPMYRDYAAIAHAHGKKLFMHSDGYILDIYPDLIELGVDCLNSQIFCMGVDNVAPYAGQICFWGELDRQYLLPHGSREEIAAAVKQVASALWRNGGCIAQLEFGAGAKPENVYQAFETWERQRMQ